MVDCFLEKMNGTVGKEKVGPARMPGLKAPGQIPVVKRSILGSAPGVVIVHVGSVVDRDSGAGVIVTTVGLDPTIPIVRPVAGLVEKVIVPANDDFAHHDRIRRPVGDRSDVK